MKNPIIAYGAFVLSIILPAAFSAQDITLHAGTHQIVNWEETRITRMNGSVSPVGLRVKWTCPQNQDVVFEDVSDPGTNVMLPRPGYFLMILTAEKPGKDPVKSSVIVNAIKPGSHQERLTDLIHLMTVDEKINQLTNLSDAIPRLDIRGYNYWNEALHGVLTSQVTSFPQAVALGSTWDPDLVYRVASAISDEARVKNVLEGKGLTYWSPTINIARDPRWGRNEESYSEDPCLLSAMGVAFVKGMQGNDPYYLKTVSTPKHFAANNEEIRRHTGSSDVDMRCLFEYYLPAFHDAVVEAKAYSIMGAYNEVNHVPCNANMFLLDDLLRRKWDFEGYVVSDCGAINDMIYGHHFFPTGAEAVARSVLAGCDLSCGEEYKLYLKEALDLNLLDEKDLDRALERVLSARFRLGEFDPPEMVPYSAIPKEKLDCEEHRKLALEAARKSIVLLKNNGILPLKKERIRSIAVMGPNAARAQLGIYSGSPNVQVSPLDGIMEKAKASGIQVEYNLGSDMGGGLLRTIEPQYFTEVEGTGQKGMKGEYFNNMNCSGEPAVVRIDPAVDFSFGTLSPAPGIRDDQFSIRWKGKIIPPETIHQIGVTNDDGARLYLDGRLIIDDWVDHGEKPNKTNVDLQAGKEHEIVLEFYDNGLNADAKLTWDLHQKDYSIAREIASRNDAVILILGITPGISQEELDRKEIELPAVQRNLIEEVSRANKNLIVVLVNGGPITLAGAEDKAGAIVEAWYAGELGGTAIADVLFGEVNPGGKLPETFYASTEQLPPFSDYDLINQPRTYMYFDQPVLFPFGHGLSYTRFSYSNLILDSERTKQDGEIEVQFDVQNDGKVTGDEVAQVYIHSVDASIKVPINQLKRFKRIALTPGEIKTLRFKIPASEFSFYDIRTNDFKVEPGMWEIQVGSSCKDIRLKKIITIE